MTRTQLCRFLRSGVRHGQSRDVWRAQQNVIVLMSQCFVATPQWMNEHLKKRHRRRDNLEIAESEALKKRPHNFDVVRVLLDVVNERSGIDTNNLPIEICSPTP
jgi:hypothetical protein